MFYFSRPPVFGGNAYNMASSAVAALMLARETQRIEDTPLLEFNSSPLDELSLDARHSLSTA